MPKYLCEITGHISEQKSHHDSHLKSQKYKQEVKIFTLKLEKLNDKERKEMYGKSDIKEIVKDKSTVIMKNTVKPKIVISNKEALKDKIHDIHNFLRNNGGGYGMNALKVFNIIYGLKKIEENNLIDLSGLTRPHCEFSYILKMAIENKDEEITELIQGDILNSIAASKIRNILFYEIPKNISGSVFSYLIKEVNEISEIEKATNTQLCGKIYEYFIGRDQTAISELGAYFTDRHITEFLYKEESPILNENLEVPTMCDPFGGSGGFTVGYLLYLNKNHPNINWKTEISKVNHFDMNEDVIKSAALEFFCITGEIPDMKSTLRYANSFTDEFSNNKYKKIFTNPPYGGDDNKKNQKQSKRDKVKNYIKNELKTTTDEGKIKQRKGQLKNIEDEEKYEKKIKEQSKVTLTKSSARIQAFAKKYALKGNDKESVSLIQLMDLVDVGGTVVGVLKEGVFFNGTYKGLRDCLIKNYNVRKVISIPSDQFENTSTKTSVLVFDNTEEKTSVVEFSELVVTKFSEDVFEEVDGQIVCTGYSGEGSKLKPDIKNVEKKIISIATAEEILANDIISFNGKDYIKNEVVPGEGYELKKLGEVCTINPKSKKKHNGEFKLVKIKDIEDNRIINFDVIENKNVKESNICLHGDIILSHVRPKSKKIVLLSKSMINNLNDICFTMPILRPTKCNPIIIYAMLKPYLNTFEHRICTGSQYPTVKVDKLKSFKIPIPKSNEKIEYWVNRLTVPFNEKNEKQALLENLQQEVLDSVKFISENEECDNFKLKDIFRRGPNGKTNTTAVDGTGDYPFYSATAENPKNMHTKFDFDCENKYFLFAKSGGNSKTIYGNSLGIGKFWLVEGKTAGNVAMIQFTVNEQHNIYYLNYYLKNILFDIQKSALYTTGNGNINVNEMLDKFNIKIPKNKKFISDLEPKFQQIEQLKLDIENAEIKFEQYIEELGNEAIKK